MCVCVCVYVRVVNAVSTIFSTHKGQYVYLDHLVLGTSILFLQSGQGVPQHLPSDSLATPTVPHNHDGMAECKSDNWLGQGY